MFDSYLIFIIYAGQNYNTNFLEFPYCHSSAFKQAQTLLYFIHYAALHSKWV